MQPRHRGRHHRITQRRLADQHIIGRAVAIAAIDTESGGRIALRIEIDDQHILTDGGQCCAEIDGGSGLANAPLLIRQRQDTRMVGWRFDLILLINLINYGHARVPCAVADGLCRSMRSSSTIQPCPPVRLECSCGLISQYLVASVNSASTSWPLGNRAFAPLLTNGSAKPISWCNGATARAVTQSTLPAILSTLSLISAKCTIPGDAVTRSASRRKAAFLALRSTRWTVAPDVSASAQASTTPGNPPPLPRSTQILADGASVRSCSESEICRVHTCGSVDGATRLVFACHFNSRSTYRSSRNSVSRETGVSFSAAVLSAVDRGWAGDGCDR